MGNIERRPHPRYVRERISTFHLRFACVRFTFWRMELHLEAFLALLEKSGYGTGGRAAFARTVPMSAGYLHDITSGTKAPSQKTIVAMARALQVPVQAITRTTVAA